MIQNFPDQMPDEDRDLLTNGHGLNFNRDNVAQPYCALATFIRWPDMPERWAGAYCSKYAFCTVEDYSLKSGLPTQAVAMATMQQYLDRSVYQLPFQYQQEYTAVRVHGETPVTCSSLTHQDTLAVHQKMTPEERTLWKRSIERRMESYEINDLPAVITFEKPVRVRICGNDDTSYSLSFESIDTALYAVSRIEENPTWHRLETFGFVFTN